MPRQEEISGAATGGHLLSELKSHSYRGRTFLSACVLHQNLYFLKKWPKDFKFSTQICHSNSYSCWYCIVKMSIFVCKVLRFTTRVVQFTRHHIHCTYNQSVILEINIQHNQTLFTFDVSTSFRDLHQKKLVLSSSGSWHDGKMPCQDNGRKRDWHQMFGCVVY